MDIRRAFATMGRHKWLFAFALIAGILLALTTLYKPVVDAGKPSLRLIPRTIGTYSTNVSLLIEDSRHGMGRSDAVAAESGILLAPTYAYLVQAEPVLRRVRSSVGAVKETITASAVKQSPVVRIEVEGSDPTRVRLVADAAGSALCAYIQEYQVSSAIPAAERASVRVLGRSDLPQVVTSRRIEIAAIMFLVPLVAVFLIAATLDNLSSTSASSKHVSPPEEDYVSKA